MLAIHPFGTEIDTKKLIEQFCNQESWEDRYRQLILLSRQLPILTTELKQQDIEIKGCESRVWLGHQRQQDNKLHFYADSEGRIVRGLLAVLLTSIEGKTPKEIVNSNLLALFDQLGIAQQLSRSRADGLGSIIDKVQKIALSYC